MQKTELPDFVNTSQTLLRYNILYLCFVDFSNFIDHRKWKVWYFRYVLIQKVKVYKLFVPHWKTSNKTPAYITCIKGYFLTLFRSDLIYLYVFNRLTKVLSAEVGILSGKFTKELNKLVSTITLCMHTLIRTDNGTYEHTWAVELVCFYTVQNQRYSKTPLSRSPLGLRKNGLYNGVVLLHVLSLDKEEINEMRL